MPTPSENAATIVAKAAEIDDLVSDFRAAKAIIDAAEFEIRQALPSEPMDAIAGRARLADYGHALMVKPSLDGIPSTEATANNAWAFLIGGGE
jgi:hypothetical protein